MASIRENRKNIAKPSKLSYSAITSLAENLSVRLGYTDGYDILASVKSLGGTIEVCDFWESDVSGGLEVHEVGKFMISVPSHTSFERDRFTIAHELGHYVLHYLINTDGSVRNDKFFATRYGSGQEEVEANWFASAYLMPSEKFRFEFERCLGNIHEVARVFKVSRQAAEVRARVLGLIVSEDPHRSDK